MDPIKHQWLANALAPESVPDQANPQLPVFRHILFAFAPIAEAADAIQSRFSEHRDGRDLVAIRDFRPSGIAKKPFQMVFLKATDGRIDNIVSAKLGQKNGHLEIHGFKEIVRIKATDVATPGKADTEITIIASQMRFRAIDEAGLRYPRPLEVAKNLGCLPVRRSPLDDDDLDIRERLRQDGADCLLHVLAIVEARDDDADEGLFPVLQGRRLFPNNQSPAGLRGQRLRCRRSGRTGFPARGRSWWRRGPLFVAAEQSVMQQRVYSRLAHIRMTPVILS